MPAVLQSLAVQALFAFVAEFALWMMARRRRDRENTCVCVAFEQAIVMLSYFIVIDNGGHLALIVIGCASIAGAVLGWAAGSNVNTKGTHDKGRGSQSDRKTRKSACGCTCSQSSQDCYTACDQRSKVAG